MRSGSDSMVAVPSALSMVTGSQSPSADSCWPPPEHPLKASAVAAPMAAMVIQRFGARVVDRADMILLDIFADPRCEMIFSQPRTCLAAHGDPVAPIPHKRHLRTLDADLVD